MKIYNKITKHLTIFRILIIIFFIGIFFIYKSEFFMFKVVDKVDSITNYQFKFKNHRTKIMNFFEEFNIPNYNSLFYKLPLIDIEIDQRNLNFFNDLFEAIKKTEQIYYKDEYILPEHPNNYTNNTNIKFYENGKVYEAKLKIHGRSEEHYIDPKKSYAIKFNKKNLYNNMREIALIILDEADIGSMWSYMLSDKFMNFKINNQFVRLKINGVDHGVYFLEEKIRREVLEKNNLTGYDLFQANASWTNQTEETHMHNFTYNIASTNVKNYSGIDNGQLIRYEKLFKSKKYNEIRKLIDIEKFAVFEAIRMLHADQHVIDGDNLKLLYDNSTGLFSPFYRSESVIGSIADYKSENTITYEKLSYNVPIFEVLNQDNEFRNLRNKYIYDIVKNKEEIIDFYKDNFKVFTNFIKEDNSNLLSQRDYVYRIGSKIDIIKDNFERLEKYIEYSKIYTQLIKKSNFEYILKISSDSNVFMNLSEINFFDNKGEEIDNLILSIYDYKNKVQEDINYKKLKNYFNNKNFILNLDDQLENLENEYTFKIKFNKEVEIDSFKVNYYNSVTGKSLNINNNYSKLINMPEKFSYNYFDNYKSLEKIYNVFGIENISLINNKIIITKGIYNLNNDIIFPFGYEVILNPGVVLKLGPNTSVVIYGGFSALGKSNEPIVVTNLLDKNFSSFLIIGDRDTSVNLKYFEISNGNEAQINGVYASGMLAIHNHNNLTIKNSKILNSISDDGLNIKNVNHFEILNSFFEYNVADQLDIDIGNGILINNTFKALKNASRSGDGLDFSGSNAIITGNKFIGFGDKGISVGEKSNVIIFNNYFEDNRSSIAAKDESKVIVFNNNYNTLDETTVLEMYIKKNIYNEPIVCVLNNDIELSNVSKIINFSNQEQKYIKNNRIQVPNEDEIKDNLKIIYSNKTLELNENILNNLKYEIKFNFPTIFRNIC